MLHQIDKIMIFKKASYDPFKHLLENLSCLNSVCLRSQIYASTVYFCYLQHLHLSQIYIYDFSEHLQ